MTSGLASSRSLRPSRSAGLNLRHNGGACILCEQSRVKILIPADALSDRQNVLKCFSCGLVFFEPRFTEAEVDPEEKVYWNGGSQKKIYFQKEIRETFVKEFESRLKTMKRYQPGCGKLLDVGCGIGHFLDTARRQGWEVRGLDISENAAAAAQEAYELKVAVGTLEDSGFTDREFDCMTLWDVIEHIRRPLENVRAANRLLRNGGILVMKTPDESSLFKQFARASYHLLGGSGSFLLKYVYYIPHYFSYTRKAMTLMLERSGFEVLEYEADETPMEFAVEKIHVHYPKDPKRKWVVAGLPWVRRLARLLKRSNKMVVYARKVRELNKDE